MKINLIPEDISDYLKLTSTPSGISWKKQPNRSTKAGDSAGTLNKRLNRWTVGFRNKTYMVYRVVYFLRTGEDLGDKLADHSDGVTSTNNIRPATASSNGANRKITGANTSGMKGVCWSKRDNKWLARIRVNGRLIYIGLYKCLTEAGRAYNEKALECFGEFAYLNEV